MYNPSSRYCLVAIIGNLLEHYNRALYSFAAPFIAPLLFSHCDRLSSLILIYAAPVIGAFARPLGSLFFGWMGDHAGRRYALSCSLIGIGLTTIAIGCLPTYHQVGKLAFIGLTLAKVIQHFCLAGETTGGAIFTLEHTEPSKRSFMSSLYDLSSILGTILASTLCLLLNSIGYMEKGWRFLFYFSGITALFGVFLRAKTEESKEFLKEIHNRVSISIKAIVFKHFRTILAVAFASGFSHITYYLAFVFMNIYAPLISSITQAQALKVNTLLLFLDLLLLPLFGWIAMKIGKEKVMLMGAFSLTLCAIPFFALLEGGSLFTVIAIRIGIIVCGVAFAAPYYAWALECVTSQYRFTLLSLASALGYYLGAPTTVICLWLYKKSALSFAPGMYLAAISSIVCCIVRTYAKETISSPLVIK